MSDSLQVGRLLLYTTYLTRLTFKNYEILELIGQGETSTVHLAVCKRGRLRDRKVALKKVRFYLQSVN